MSRAYIPHPGSRDPWDLWKLCGGIYVCPRDAENKPIGPLVPYAGKDATGKNLVGYEYANFAAVEEYPRIVAHFASLIANQMLLKLDFGNVTTVVGVPDGGRTLGQAIAEKLDLRFVYLGKNPVPSGSATPGKAEYDLGLPRFTLNAEDRVLVADDVHNNFANTDKTLAIVAGTGARILGLCSALNRSPTIDGTYTPASGPLTGRKLPIVTAIRRPIPEFRQDDMEVVAHIAAGNVEWNVKANWARLMSIMEKPSGN